MVTATSVSADLRPSGLLTSSRPKTSLEAHAARRAPRDKLDLGRKPLSTKQTQEVILERAMAKLRAVVDEAKAALGIPEDAVIDTSPEATADRIADFALNFFAKYAANHGLADDEAGRGQFASFIGGAIAQGIEEARGILGALQALNGGVEDHIRQTADHIWARLEAFVRDS